ncbi:MAG: DUF2934 domain-containing protein [Variovorax sp.]|nr:MAG: DUF2934 domain-containing protein [Variovorax sp.]
MPRRPGPTQHSILRSIEAPMNSIQKLPNLETTTNAADNTSQADTTPLEPLSSAEPSREDRIREAAYAAADRRGFAPGHELEDWLAAEETIDAPASGEAPGSP